MRLRYPRRDRWSIETWTTVALEVNNVVRCGDYPSSGSTSFSFMSLQNTVGTSITPSWAANVLQNDGCGESVLTGGTQFVSPEFLAAEDAIVALDPYGSLLQPSLLPLS